MDAVCSSSSSAATPIQFVLLLLPGNLLFEEWLSWGEKKRVREFDNVFEGAILTLFHHHVHYLALLSSLVLARSGVV